jgi:polysaccharide export outer membrane protein
LTAAGLTPTQLKEKLAKSLADYIPTAAVSVIVNEVNSYKVAVIGEVKEPGRYQLKSLATVLDVLAMAKGLNDYAEGARIVVLRREGSGVRQIPFDYSKVTSPNGSSNGTHGNIVVRPNDIIVVP